MRAGDLRKGDRFVGESGETIWTVTRVIGEERGVMWVRVRWADGEDSSRGFFVNSELSRIEAGT